MFVGVVCRDKRVERPEPLEGVLARISNLLTTQNRIPIGFGPVGALDTVPDSLGLAYALGQGQLGRSRLCLLYTSDAADE